MADLFPEFGVKEGLHRVGVPFLDTELLLNLAVLVEQFDNWVSAPGVLNFQSGELIWLLALNECLNLWIPS